MSEKLGADIAEFLDNVGSGPTEDEASQVPTEPVHPDSEESINSKNVKGLEGEPSQDPQPTEEEVVEDAPQAAALKALQDEIANLRNELAHTKGLVEGAKAQQKQDDQDPSQKPQDIPMLFTADEVKELEEGDGTQLVKVFNAALYRTVSSAMQALQASMPQTIAGVVDRQVVEKKAVSSFYTANPDLAEHTGLVGYVAQEIVAEGKGLSMKALMEETAKRTRKMLRLPEGGEKNPPQREIKKPSGQPGGAGGRQGGPGTPAAKPDPKSIEGQIASIFS